MFSVVRKFRNFTVYSDWRQAITEDDEMMMRFSVQKA